VALTVTLLLSTLLAAALLVTALTPARVAVWLGCAANVVQLHTISILGIYPSLALLCWLAPWRSVLRSPLWRWPWMQALLALAVVQAASIAWSPTPLLAIRHLVYLLPLPIAAHAFYRLSREQPAFARGCIRVLLLGSALEAVLVIVFRVLPSVELEFLSHPIARLFVSANTLDALFYAARNNVLDAAKAGGVFVNGNIAAAYLGMSAVAAWYVARIARSSSLRAVAVLDWTAILFTGSKAGLLCAIVVPLGLTVISVIRARQANPVTLFAATLALGVGAVSLSLPLSQDLLEDYRYNTLATLGSREEIWAYALQMIQQHPITGLGFGGWEQRFQLHSLLTGAATTVPPHNSLFILWLQSGLPGMLVGLGLVAAIYAAAARALAAHDRETLALAMAALGAFSWYFIQGLGENFGLIGEVHMTPLLGVLLGHLCARYDCATGRYELEHESLRGDPPPSAVPAV
jgi:O-antigen ligase